MPIKYASKFNRKQLPVDFRLSIMKPLGARWMIQLHDYLQSKPEIIRNGFKGAGIVDYLTK